MNTAVGRAVRTSSVMQSGIAGLTNTVHILYNLVDHYVTKHIRCTD